MANIIEMPKLSDTMIEGELIKWLKKEGDPVKSGDMLAEVQTDKATMELESFFDGVLLKIFAPAGSKTPLGAPLCAIGKPGETVEAPKTHAPEAAADKPAPAPKPAASPAAVPAPQSAPTPVPVSPAAAAPQAPAPAEGERVRISPLAKKMAEEKKIDYTRIKGSGPGGRIVREDVLAAEKNPPPAKAGSFTGGVSAFAKGPIQEDKAVALSSMRAIIARRLLESKNTIPHFYLDIEVDAGPLMDLRSQLNTALEKEGVKLSVNDFILKASAEALRKVPAVNASWDNTQIKYHSAAHVSFAVAIPDGLITPVIRDTHLKSLFAVSSEAKSLGKRAKDMKLQPAEFTGGTFCVSNLGMMGIEKFCAIINPPNAAILAVGTTRKKPVVKDDQIVIGQTMTLTLSVDHRVVDGAVGAAYLSALKGILENPAILLV